MNNFLFPFFVFYFGSTLTQTLPAVAPSQIKIKILNCTWFKKIKKHYYKKIR